MTQPTASTSPVTIALDTGDRNIHFCALENREVVDRGVCPTTREGLDAALGAYPGASRLLSIYCDVPRPGAEAMEFGIDVRTDGDGEFDLPVLPGRYSVVDWSNYTERMLCADEIATVAPGQVRTTAFHLWSGTLRLTLRTAAGAPARGIAPRFWNRTAREHYVHDERTDEHGVVEVELSAGDYEVQRGELGPEGTTFGTVAIRPGGRTEARLSLPR